jgi:hypothetical protein
MIAVVPVEEAGSFLMSAPDFLIEGGDFCSWHLASYPHGATVPPTPMGLVLFDQLREIVPVAQLSEVATIVRQLSEVVATRQLREVMSPAQLREIVALPSQRSHP